MNGLDLGVIIRKTIRAIARVYGEFQFAGYSISGKRQDAVYAGVPRRDLKMRYVMKHMRDRIMDIYDNTQEGDTSPPPPPPLPQLSLTTSSEPS